MTTILDWIRAHPWLERHPDLLWWMGGISVATFVGSLVAIPIIVSRIPADYFIHPEPPPDSFRDRHPVLRYTVRVVKNVVGAILLVVGIAMLILPGQAIMTMLAALMLLNFPGKRRLERWIVSRPPVARSLNWLRHRTGREPLRLPTAEAIDYPRR